MSKKNSFPNKVEINNELHIKAEELKWLFDGMLDAFVIFDPVYNDQKEFISYRFVYINQAYEKITGVKLEDVKGKTVHEIWPATEDSWVKKYGHVSYTGETLVFNEYHEPTQKSYHCRVFRPWTSSKRFCVIFNDITKQEKMLGKLKESEYKYRNLISTMMNAFALHEMIFDKDGQPIDYRFLEVNPAWENVVGMKADKVIGKTIKEIMPDIEQSWIDLYGRVVKTGKSEEFEDYNKTTGRYYHVYAYSPDDDKFAVFFNDISDRKMIENELRKAKEEAEQFLDLSGSIILALDDHGNISMINKAGIEILGYDKKKDVIGKNWFKTFLLPEKKDLILKRFKRLMNGEVDQNKYIEEFVLTKSGEKRSIMWQNTLIRDSDERIIGTLSSGTDITERIESEEKILDSERRYRSYIDHAPNAVFVVDNKGNYLQANPAAEKITGYSLDEILQMNVADFSPDEENLNIALKSFKELQKNNEMSITMSFKKKDGSIGWWTIDAVRLSDDRFIGFSADVTEKVLADKLLTEQKNLLDAIIDQTPFPTFISNDTGTMIRVNNALLNTLNYKEEQLVGVYNLLTDINLIEQGTISLVREVFQKHHTVQFAQFWEKEKIGIKNLKGGKDLFIDVTIFPIVNKDDGLEYVVTQWMDITEQTLAEQKIRESEEKYRFLVENQSDLIVTIDNQLHITFANPNYCRVFGTDEKNIINRTFIPLIHKDDIDKVKASIEIVQKPPYTSYHEERAKTVDGWRWFGWSLKANPDENGNIDQIVAVGRDITNRKKAEEEKNLSENRYRELVNTINSGVAVYKVINDGRSGSDYIIQEFNTTALELENRNDVVGKSLKEIRPGIDEYGLIDIFRKVWKTGEPAYYPAKLYKDEKYANYYENRIFRLPSNEIVAVYDDVTDKTLANMKLKQSEERFELAMKASKDGLYDWNLITNEIYYSPGWKSMLGYDYDELPNDFSVWETLTDPQDVKTSWEKLNKVIEGELDRFEMEFKMKHKDGHWVDILSRANAIFDDSGKAVRMIGTHVDISEQKRTENELIEAMNKAKESDRLKSAFLANMSHEVRTPMNGILGFSNLLKQHDVDLEKRQEYIDIIQQSGKRMLNTINDLINISRIESGQVEVRNSYMNLNDKMNELFQFFKLEAEQKSLDLSFTMELDKEKAQVYTDAEKVHAILSNFINNAIKFTEKGSIKFGYRIVKDQIEFFVSDTGRGIGHEHFDKIFDRFVQADQSLTRAYEGSGLGLSISKAYAGLLHGRIRVESEPNQGSTFYLYIPYTLEHLPDKEKSIDKPEKKSKDDDFSDINVLIAEDDEASIIYLEALLGEKFKTVYFSTNGKDVIQKIKEHPEIDLILMDVKMPILDGLSATREIRKFNRDIKIIAQTAYAMESDNAHALEAGCDGYISKPLNEEDLFKLIARLFK
jgi:PAS domain S-box-containing protein